VRDELLHRDNVEATSRPDLQLSFVGMTEAIPRKLTDELNKGITIEVQVVYLLAGIRKLIERDKKKDQLWFARPMRLAVKEVSLDPALAFD
jgi:hypothetical protein